MEGGGVSQDVLFCNSSPTLDSIRRLPSVLLRLTIERNEQTNGAEAANLHSQFFPPLLQPQPRQSLIPTPTPEPRPPIFPLPPPCSNFLLRGRFSRVPCPPPPSASAGPSLPPHDEFWHLGEGMVCLLCQFRSIPRRKKNLPKSAFHFLPDEDGVQKSYNTSFFSPQFMRVVLSSLFPPASLLFTMCLWL